MKVIDTTTLVLSEKAVQNIIERHAKKALTASQFYENIDVTGLILKTIKRVGETLRVVIQPRRTPKEVKLRHSFSCTMYDQGNQDNVELRGIYELKSSEPKSFPFTDLLTHVNLAVTENNRLEIGYE